MPLQLRKTLHFKGDMPYVEGTPTHELLKDVLVRPAKDYYCCLRPWTLTGQRKPSTKFSQLSTAVTQGSDVFVINALKVCI